MGIFGLKADPELRAMLSHYSGESVKRKALDCIFKQGQKSHGMYLISTGALRLSIEANPDARLIDRVVGPGYLVGLPAKFNGNTYSLTCEVVEDAELIYLSRRDVATLMRCEPEAAMKLLDLLSNEVQAVRAELARTPRAYPTAISAYSN
jgi:CRP-like cAMP-binding protein